jgi:hypothetical protein
MRSAVFILVAVIAGLPLTARADLWINYKNLHVISTQRGCHLEHSDDKEKRSVVRCDPYAMTSSPHFTTYTQTWGRRTDDPRYGGCNTRSWTIALPPAKHQFDIELTSNSERAAIICKYNWQNNNTVDVYFLDKIPAKPLELHIRGIANASSIHLYNTGLCYWQVPGDPTTTSCKSAGEVGVTYLTPGGSQKRPCTVKIWPQLMFIVPMWHVQLLSNDGACHLTQVDHYNWNVNVKT